MSGKQCALIALAAAGAAAAMAFRAGRLAAKAGWPQADEKSASAGVEAPSAPQSAPGGEAASDFSEWEQATVPRDS